MEAEFWTLPMAAAWFLWRDPQAVRDQWNVATKRWTPERRPLSVLKEGTKRFVRVAEEITPGTLANVFSQAGFENGPSFQSRAPNSLNACAQPGQAVSPYDRMKLAFESEMLIAFRAKPMKDGVGLSKVDWQGNFDLFVRLPLPPPQQVIQTSSRSRLTIGAVPHKQKLLDRIALLRSMGFESSLRDNQIGAKLLIDDDEYINHNVNVLPRYRNNATDSQISVKTLNGNVKYLYHNLDHFQRHVCKSTIGRWNREFIACLVLECLDRTVRRKSRAVCRSRASQVCREPNRKIGISTGGVGP
jgi:hypothetical protein